MSKDLAEVRRDGLRLLKQYLRAPEQDRTPILRSLAENVVETRGHFSRADGSPDWKGRSYAYRVYVREFFSDAGVQKSDLPTIQAAIRYHVGAVLRERLDEETLADYDLMPQSPRERSADRRHNRTALLSALTARDVSGGALVALTAAQTLLSRVSNADVDDLEGASLTVADETLAEVEKKTRSLRRRIANRA